VIDFEHVYDWGMAATLRVERLIEDLALLDGADLDDPARIDLISALERVKGAAAAAQARVTVAFADSQLAGAGRSREEQALARRSVGSQVALARRVSPSLGDRFVGLARALVTELPHTMAALSAGDIHEHAAVEVTRATAAVDTETRHEVDRRLAADLPTWTARRAGLAARRIVAELDAAAVVRAQERAVSGRRVSLRPAPDGMAYLTVLGPLREAVGAYAALRAHAASVASGHGPDGELPGDRPSGAVMADAALRWMSGRHWGEAQPVAVQLLMTDRTLAGIGDPARSPMEPARVVGHGPVAAPTARAWLRAHPEVDEDAQTWVRRLFTAPTGRDLVALESRSTLFPAKLKEALVLRDDTCRTPWCDAPVAHADHITSRAQGGPTSYLNGQGLCARCNQTKQAPGWRTEVGAPRGAGHETLVTTPTGHRHRSSAPPLLGSGWDPPPDGAVDSGVGIDANTSDPWDDVDWGEIEADHPEWWVAA
jgi:hypothetical protein